MEKMGLWARGDTPEKGTKRREKVLRGKRKNSLESEEPSPAAALNPF
jgi:hypothetical protein